MERRIKTLYIITIIAILAFLGMQVYWLTVRYEFSLKEYEGSLSELILSCIDQYNHRRETDVNNKKSADPTVFTIPQYFLSQQYGDTVKTTRIAKLLLYHFSAHSLLGLQPETILTYNQLGEAHRLAQERLIMPMDSLIFNASGAKDENEAWSATRNVELEISSPFTKEGLDSVLSNAEIAAKIALVKSDSAVWKTNIVYHNSSIRPVLSIKYPYSQLEGKTVSVDCTINPLNVIPGMWQTLLIAIVVSTLLIICLVMQISTVRRLSRLDKMRNSFVTTMIHELKRPISTLKMCVSGMGNEKMMADESTRRELLGETRNALDILSAYFSRVRDITFNNVEQIPLNISSGNLHELVDNVISSTRIPSGKTVRIQNNIDKDTAIQADPTHFYNVLYNLVENAVKYSGKDVEIQISATCGDNYAEIRVSDNGNGIPSSELKNIFNRFYRGKESANDIPGMGLGLAYVRLLVEAHGGRIDVESREGEGTCFTIRLPQ